MRRAKHASAVAALLALVWMPGPPAWAQAVDLADPPDAVSETPPDIRPSDLKASGWRVECANDGSLLSCVTVLRLLRDGDSQPLVTLAVTRLNAAQTLDLGLPLGGFGLAYEKL